MSRTSTCRCASFQAGMRTCVLGSGLETSSGVPTLACTGMSVTWQSAAALGAATNYIGLGNCGEYTEMCAGSLITKATKRVASLTFEETHQVGVCLRNKWQGETFEFKVGGPPATDTVHRPRVVSLMALGSLKEKTNCISAAFCSVCRLLLAVSHGSCGPQESQTMCMRQRPRQQDEYVVGRT